MVRSALGPDESQRFEQVGRIVQSGRELVHGIGAPGTRNGEQIRATSRSREAATVAPTDPVRAVAGDAQGRIRGPVVEYGARVLCDGKQVAPVRRERERMHVAVMQSVTADAPAIRVYEGDPAVPARSRDERHHQAPR